jgi:DNA-binding NarL/FixJ family response regulator
MTIRVLIADDHALVRAGFALVVGNEPGMRVVGEAANGTAAVTLARSTRPDVVLMDIRMPGLDGIEATRRITADPAVTARVLILTTFDLDEYVFGALRAGASGFLVEDTRPALLLEAIRTLAVGEACWPPAPPAASSRSSPATPHPQPGPMPPAESLTSRERDVLGLVGRGLSNTEICQQLHISMATTKTHIGRLLTKFGARDRAQLVIAAYQSGLVAGWSGRGRPTYA